MMLAQLRAPHATCLTQSTLCPCSETNYIIHCAASIRFDEPISTIMRTNYACTRDLLNLAAGMPGLRCFSYMSTTYVNSNQPRHSRICEKIYPLPGTEDPLQTAQELLEMPEKQATKQASLWLCRTCSSKARGRSAQHQPFYWQLCAMTQPKTKRHTLDWTSSGLLSDDEGRSLAMDLSNASC